MRREAHHAESEVGTGLVKGPNPLSQHLQDTIESICFKERTRDGTQSARKPRANPVPDRTTLLRFFLGLREAKSVVRGAHAVKGMLEPVTWEQFRTCFEVSLALANFPRSRRVLNLQNVVVVPERDGFA